MPPRMPQSSNNKIENGHTLEGAQVFIFDVKEREFEGHELFPI
jgi:hypothetical protein